MAGINPFSWGSNGQKASPSSVKKYAEIAAALAAKSGAPQNLGEGFARVGDALLYNSANSRAAEGEAEGAASRKAVLDALMSNPDPSMTDIAGAMGNEWVASDPGSTAVVQALMAQENQQNDWAHNDSLRAEDRQFALDDRAAQQQFAISNRDAGWAHDDNAPVVINDQLVQPGDVPKVLGDYRTPVAPKPPSVETLYDEQGRAQPSTWDGTKFVPVGGAKAPASPMVTVNTGDAPDAALNKALSTKEGEAWSGYKDAAAVSASNAQDFDVLGELLQQAPQGPIVGRLADTFKGFNAAGDAANSIIKRVAPTLRAPGSGATSDIEYEGMLKSLPSLAQLPEANAMVLSIMQAKAQVNMERGRIVTAYQNGDMTVGQARKAMDDLNSKSIMTPDMRKALLGVGGDGNVTPAQSTPVGEGTVIEDGNGNELVLRNGQWEPVT